MAKKPASRLYSRLSCTHPRPTSSTRTLREAGRGFLYATDKDLEGPPAQTPRHLSLTQAILIAELVQTRCASHSQSPTWKKEAIFFFPSSQAIHPSRGVAIQVSGKGFVPPVRSRCKCPRAVHLGSPLRSTKITEPKTSPVAVNPLLARTPPDGDFTLRSDAEPPQQFGVRAS
jgi:hypothetical protein